MPRVIHIVTTTGFAGVERYVTNVAAATAARGWDVVIVGGSPAPMVHAAGASVVWKPGGRPFESVCSTLRLGRADVVHAHMTLAEAVAVVTRPMHRAPIVSTRHFAAERGQSTVGRLFAPWIGSGISLEIAISQFVADRLERPPSTVLVNGVPTAAVKWRVANRVVLVLQRLEAEKDTLTALRAWQASSLSSKGWSMRVVGDGSQREDLKHYVADQDIPGVVFVGRTDDVAAELANAGMLVATATAEPLGLSVLEAMAAGVPVVASRAGGHLETVGKLDAELLFAPGDPGAAANAMCRLSVDTQRTRASERVQLTADRFSLDRHIDTLLHEYELAAGGCALPPQDLVTGR